MAMENTAVDLSSTTFNKQMIRWHKKIDVYLFLFCTNKACYGFLSSSVSYCNVIHPREYIYFCTLGMPNINAIKVAYLEVQSFHNFVLCWWLQDVFFFCLFTFFFALFVGDCRSRQHFFVCHFKVSNVSISANILICGHSDGIKPSYIALWVLQSLVPELAMGYQYHPSFAVHFLWRCQLYKSRWEK